MKKWSVGTITNLIALYSILCLLILYVLGTLKLDFVLNNGILGLLIGFPAIMAYFSAPTIGLVVFPLLTASKFYSILKTVPKERIYLDIGLFVCLLYDLYIIWWYVSGQQWPE